MLGLAACPRTTTMGVLPQTGKGVNTEQWNSRMTAKAL